MKKDRQFRTLVVMVALVALVALSVGYATLSLNLNINGTTKVKKADWSILFNSLETPVTVGTGKSESTNLTDTTFTFGVSLVKPKDSVTYVWKVTNAGDVDAKIGTTPVVSGIDAATAANVSYALTYEDGSLIEADNKLPAGESKTLKLVVSYNDVTTTAAADIDLTLSTTLNYVQD
ncbi:MAG TPA: hypothetical protein PLV83_03465 [Bacilli bacterium]|nr:hypothetical protein [Bacilli bacterium]